MRNKDLFRQKVLMTLLIVLVIIFVGFNVAQQYVYRNSFPVDSIKLEKVIEKQVYVESSASTESIKRFSESVFNVVPKSKVADLTLPVSVAAESCFDDMSLCNNLALMLTSDGLVIYGGEYRENPASELALVDFEGNPFQVEKIADYQGFVLLQLIKNGESVLVEEKRTKIFDIKPVMLADFGFLKIGQRVITLFAAVPGYQEIAEGVLTAKLDRRSSILELGEDFKFGRIKFSNDIADNGVYYFDLGGGLVSMRSVGGNMINSYEIQYLLERMEDDKSLDNAAVNLGLKCIPLDRELSLKLGLLIDYGCVVAGSMDKNMNLIDLESVTKGGAAEAAGIKFKDIILEIDNASLLHNDFVSTVMGISKGSVVDMIVLRGKETRDLKLQL